MVDKRRKDVPWKIYSDQRWKGAWPDSYYYAMQLAVLMDIRDELKRLNSIICCPNFIGIPSTLNSIRTNTAKPRRKAKKP